MTPEPGGFLLVSSGLALIVRRIRRASKVALGLHEDSGEAER
jgi:hypothetical protein